MLANLNNEVFFKKVFTNVDVFCAFVKDVLGIEMHISKVETEKVLDTKVSAIEFRMDLFAEDKDNRTARLLGSTLILYFSVSISTTLAQMTAVDSLFLQETVHQTVAVYHAAIGNGSALFNGPKYSDYPKIKDGGHAFFNTLTPSKCSIVYDKVFYPNVNLLYDEVTGVVVVQDATRRIQLETDKITQFTVWDNRFTRLAKDSTSTATLSGGFYQILYEGKTTGLFKQETKRIEEDIRSVSDGIVRSIIVKKGYFIQKNGVCHAVKDKKDVLSLFNDRKKEVAQFLKRNKLDFEKDTDNAFIKVIAFYDALL